MFFLDSFPKYAVCLDSIKSIGSIVLSDATNYLSKLPAPQETRRYNREEEKAVVCLLPIDLSTLTSSSSILLVPFFKLLEIKRIVLE